MKDPFMIFSPFREHEKIVIRHVHEILISFILYQFIINPIVAKWINKFVFRSHYNQISKRDQINFDIHTVSMIQSILCVAILYPVMWLPVNLPLFGYYNEYASMISAVTVGYFIWDLYVCVKYFKLFGAGFLAHAIGSLLVMLCGLRPSFQQWIAKFLIFEISTPFANVNWYITQILRTTEAKSSALSALKLVNGILLLITFFLGRIVWGSIGMVLLDYQVWKQWNSETPVMLGVLVPMINVIMSILNVYWFLKMLCIAKNMYNGKRKVTKVY